LLITGEKCFVNNKKMADPGVRVWISPLAQGFLVGMGGVAGQEVNGGFGRGAAFHYGPVRGCSGPGLANVFDVGMGQKQVPDMRRQSHCRRCSIQKSANPINADVPC